jgi:exodeoxyribonuclease III
MKIATWNVNSIRTRQQIVVDWLQKNPVDVLCLQETKVIDADFPRLPFEELNYSLYISGQKAYNGVAIFSKNPLENVSNGFASILGESATNFDAQKRVITGVIGDVRIVNLYVPNGSEIGNEKYEYKLAWLKLLREYLQESLKKGTEKLCVCGDFNIVLEDKDIHDAKGKEKHIMYSPAERQALSSVIEIGLADVFRKFTSEGGHFSWWDYRSAGFQRDRGWRIDHIYLSRKLYQKATSCAIDIEPRKLEKPSDHAPVIVEF